MMPRRAFLQGLAQLPLIGGGVSLIGQPTAVAQPVTRTLLVQYWNWLFYERRILCHEMAGGDREAYRRLQSTHGGDPGDEIAFVSRRSNERADSLYYPEFHFPRFGQWTDVPKPSTRAALVMGAVDFDWRPVPR